MAMTVTDYQSAMLHAIGNADPSTGITTLQVLNEALRELFTYHDWSWRKRPPLTLGFTANQSYVTLPSDFGELVDVSAIYGTIYGVQKAGLDDIARYRGAVVQPTGQYLVAVSWPTQVSTGVRPSTPRLEVWPTPLVTSASAMRIIYKAGPIDLSLSGDVPNIPKEYESAMVFLARGKLQAYELDGAAPDYQTGLALLEKLRDFDGLQELDAGRITGGAIANRRPLQWRPFPPTFVPNH